MNVLLELLNQSNRYARFGVCLATDLDAFLRREGDVFQDKQVIGRVEVESGSD